MADEAIMDRPGPNGAGKSSAAPVGKTCSIGRAAETSGVSPKMIRHYESIGLVRPAARSAANYRSYDDTAIQSLRFVARARLLGFSMAEIARLLALWQEPGRSSADVKALALCHVAELDRRITALQGMKDTIENLARQCCGDERPECPIIRELAGETQPIARARRRRADA